MRYIALLRGINVGGNRKLPMAELRRLLESLGYDDVATYLQSGNALFTTDRTDVATLEREIAQAIEESLGLDVPTLLRTPDDLERVIAANPFPHALEKPAYFQVSFLTAQPDPTSLDSLDRSLFEPEEFHLGERALYLWCPEGFGNSKLGKVRWERLLGVKVTSRNWNTVTTLLELATR